MKKIFASLSIVLCLIFAMVGMGGCSSHSPSDLDETENGGQIEVEKITTLEGVWESEYRYANAHEKVIVEGSSIRCYAIRSFNSDVRLCWAGIYVPFNEAVSEGSWTFESVTEWPIDWKEGSPIEYAPKTFYYSNGKLSCRTIDSDGDYRMVTHSRVEK